MRAYLVLVYGGRPSPPVLHLVTAQDDTTASIFADVLLVEACEGVGVRVTNWDGEQIYARGLVPPCAGRKEAVLLERCAKFAGACCERFQS